MLMINIAKIRSFLVNKAHENIKFGDNKNFSPNLMLSCALFSKKERILAILIISITYIIY